MASRAIPWHRLFHQRARPHQRCHRGVDHEQVTRLLGRPIWPGRRRVLLELHPVPGAQQRDARPHRRATLDHHHHARMGTVFRCNRSGIRHNQLRHCAIHAGRRGGWLLLRRDLLHDTLVPRPTPVHGDGRILRLRRAGRLHRFTHLGQHPGAAWVARIAGLAMDLPARGRARSRARGIRSIRAVRPAGRRTLAHARREGLAAGQARLGATRGSRLYHRHSAGAAQPVRGSPDDRLSLHRVRRLRERLLPAADHQGHGLQQHRHQLSGGGAGRPGRDRHDRGLTQFRPYRRTRIGMSRSPRWWQL